MRAILIIPEGIQEGNLIWYAPYLYPEDQLEDGISVLRGRGYFIEPLEKDWEYGLAFRSPFTLPETLHDFNVTFRWMDIIFYDDEKQINLERDFENYSLIVMPVGRLQIKTAIVTETVCLFPPGEFRIHNLYNLDGTPFGNPGSKNLRDEITRITPVDISVFECNPLIVFRKALTHQQFRSFNHQDDVEFIRECSDISDNLMDIVRFFNADYLSPEWLPSKTGIWADRHSAMFLYFPEKRIGHIVCREVELRSFTMGVGMSVEHVDQISLHPLLFKETNDLHKLIRHALRLNTLIMETDNESMKLIQIFILLDFLGDPYAYRQFQDIKKKLIPCLVSNMIEYDTLSERFKELTGPEGLRTAIVHMGKQIQELLPNSPMKKNLFQELHEIVHGLILHMMLSFSGTWEEYENERQALRDRLFGLAH